MDASQKLKVCSSDYRIVLIHTFLQIMAFKSMVLGLPVLLHSQAHLPQTLVQRTVITNVVKR